MKVYVIYKFADHGVVAQALENVQSNLSDENRLFMFRQNHEGKNWRTEAIRNMKDSQLVVLFDTFTGKGLTAGKHIAWEMAKAKKLGKRVVVFADSQKTAEEYACYECKELDAAAGYLTKEFSWSLHENLCRKSTQDKPYTDTEKQLLLEQYRIMIDTSEKLMERRQETVNLYTTLCTTLIAFIGASFAFGNLSICAAITFVSGLMLLVLCRNWRISLVAYDLNNYGKFEVINTLEEILPAEIFKCEYRYNKRNGIQSFSAREKVLPTIFAVLGGILMAFSLVVALVLLLNKIGIL